MKKYLLISLTIIFSCSKTSNKLTISNVFPKQKNTDSTFVFSLDTINSVNDLDNYLCKVIKQNKSIYLRNNNLDINLSFSRVLDCNKLRGCFFYGDKKNIEISYHDSLIVEGEKEKFTVNNYQNILKQYLLKTENASITSPEQVFNLVEVYNYNLHWNDTVNFPELRTKLSNKLDTISLAYYNILKELDNNVSKIDSLKQKHNLLIILTNPIPKPPILDEPLVLSKF